MRFVRLLLAVLFAAPAFAARQRAVTPPGAGMSEVRRVFVVILENEEEGVALQQPFLAALAARGALLRNYHAVAHPSQPNYIALVAGSTYSIANDNPVTLDVEHLGDLLELRGISWKVYAEDYPGACYLGVQNGAYVRRHLPFLSFADIQNDPRRCAEHIVNAVQLDDDVAAHALPRFALYVPNVIHDGHDTSVAVADAWLQARFEPLLADPSFAAGLLFIVVFDEGKLTGPNIVYCSFSGAGVRPGSVSDASYDHYSLLRTIEELLHAATLGRFDAHAAVIDDIWRTP
jgi:acid phosphatase